MADRVGQRLGNYRLIRLVGEGGFAEVYLGEHIHLGSQAAIKVLHTQLTGDDMGQFRAEARTIAYLEHPHIVRVLEFGLEGKTPFLVMSYAPNGTLRQQHPKGTSIPLVTIISYVKQVADALQYAHDENLIHRDIKPENMLVGRRNEVLLSDFGIATMAQSSRYQSTQDVIGTVAYMAPEQIQGKPRPASDQYSLGVVVYEWISGSRPFHGSFTELCTQHMFASPPPLRDKIPKASIEAEQVVLTALAKDPKGRFANVKAFASALEQASQSVQPLVPSPTIFPSSQPQQSINVLTSLGQTLLPGEVVTPLSRPLQPTIAATPPNQLLQSMITTTSSGNVPHPTVVGTLPSSTRPPMQRLTRRGVLAGWAGGTIAIVAGGSLIGLVLSRNHQASPSSTPRPTSIPIGTILLTYKGVSGYASALAWAPTGNIIAVASDIVYVWDANTGHTLLTYRGHTSYLHSLAWSHGGTSIASGGGDINSASSDNSVQVWNATTGNQISVFRNHTNAILGITWSPNDQQIASCAFENTIYVWDAGTGNINLSYTGHNNALGCLAWSPNGQRIVSGDGQGYINIWDPNSGNTLMTYLGHTSQVNGVAWSPDGKLIASVSGGNLTNRSPNGQGDSSLQVWDPNTGHTLFRIVSGAWTAAWSPDGKRILITSVGHQIYNASNGKLLYTFQAKSGITAWSPDGTRIASESDNKTVVIWQSE